MTPATTRTALAIMGMRDNACRERIAEVLEAVPGVRDVDVNLHRARATIVHERSSTLDALLGAVVRAGYGASLNGAEPDRAGTRVDPHPPAAAVVKATGVLRRGFNVVHPYVPYRILDARTGRLYALTSIRHRVPLERHVGERVTVYGTRVPGYPVHPRFPLLDVFRVVPLAKPSSA